ncbi:MAG: glycosyltransferase 87 family protein [Acidimicrobiales bacterium]
MAQHLGRSVDSDRATWARRTLLAAVVGAESAWILTLGSFDGAIRWVPLLVVVAVHAGLVTAEHRRPLLGLAPILVASGVVIAVAVVVAPFGSRDVYLYSFYGRMVTKYHLNPHLVTPNAVAADPLLSHVEGSWRDSTSLYGPVFTAFAAAGSLIYGSSALAARVFFQATAGVSVLVATWYLHRRGRPSSILVAIGLSPVLLATVNGAHNDMMAGLLALIGLDLAARGRGVLGPAVVAVGCAVKLLVLPVAVAVIVVPLMTRRWGAAARSAAVVAGVLAASYLPVGGLATLGALRRSQATISRLSPWRLLPDAADLVRSGHVSTLAAGASLVAVAVLIWRSRPDPDAATLAVAFGVVVCLGAAYSLPWYAAAFLPLAACGTTAVPRRALTVGASVMLVGYVAPPGALMSSLDFALPVARAARWVLGALVVWAVVATRQPTPRRSTTNTSVSSGPITPPAPRAP